MIPGATESTTTAIGLPAMPPWARRRETVDSLSDQAFLAGAAVGVIDHLVRSNPPWLGVLAARLALHAAAVSCRHLGRAEDEQALRDLWVMRSASIAPGPPGRVLMAWQRLGRHDALSEIGLVTAAGHLGLSERFAGGDLADEITDLTKRRGPLGAAEAAAAAIARAGHRDAPGELLALWVANAVLARRLRWSVALPLIGQEILQGGAGRPRPGDAEWGGALARGLVAGSGRANDLAAELRRRADRLNTVAPKLRTKGARNVIETLLREDAIAPSKAEGILSDRAARRLFDRLVTLGGVRELSGRPTFRLYGL